jgi:amino acid adenylation domain-containing protein
MKSGPVAHQDESSLDAQGVLSISQQRLWLLDQIHPRNPAQNLCRGLRLTGPLDVEGFRSAWRAVAEPCEILRTEFHIIEGTPKSAVAHSSSPHLSLVDLEGVAPEQREVRLLQLAREEAQRPFDLSSGPLLRASFWRVAPSEHVFLLVANRIVCDEASLDVLLRELEVRYGAIRESDGRATVRPNMQYSEFISRQSQVPEHQFSYWKRQLAAVPASLDLPLDRPRPPQQTFSGASQLFSIEKPLLERLRSLGETHGATLDVALLAAFNVLLFRYSGQDDLVVGTAVSGRVDPRLKDLVGPFENMVALRTNLSGGPSFSKLLARVRDVTAEAFRNQDVPFEILLEELPLQRDLSRHPLFQVVFSLRPARSNGSWAGGLSVAPFEVESATERFDISLDLVELGDSIEGRLSYNTDLFDVASIARMIGNFRVLLQSAAQNPDLEASRLPLLTSNERHQLLVEWNDTRVEYPTDVPLHKFIEEQAEKTPKSVAVIYESEQLTYGQLNARANQLARRLQKLGVGANTLVAVCMERSLELVTALLAILKAGGAYVPLDPEYPRDRLETMLLDSAPPVILSQTKLLDQLPDSALPVFCLDRDWSSAASESSDNLTSAVSGKNLAYAIYTSGSTGKPKGVPNVHEGIVNRLLWMQAAYKLTGQDRVLQKTPFSFDVSVWEFFWPLMTGAPLVVARPGGHRDPSYLVNLIAEHGITTLHFVPSMLSIFLEAAGLERCRTLRQVFASGEALSFELQQRFFERLPAELHNLYGPTEASVDVTYWPCRPDSPQPIVPIGRPIANTQIYILDANLEPVPIRVAGELHIGGIGLATGYLNRPELTAQKFIPNPFANSAGARLYKTGDLARFLPDGNIEYLGRIDHQVKLRGFRIELGEIEAVLGESAAVRSAVVVLREDNPGDKRLVAYLIAAPAQKLDIEQLQREVKDKLPDHMVPSRFVIVEEFPMTTSGKIDRKALPAPPPERRVEATVAPRDALESNLASIFTHVLGLPTVSITDNFFDLGGHSLTAARLLSEVEKVTGRQIPLSALFRGATVMSLAQLIREQVDANDPVVMEIQRGDSSRLPFFAIVPPGEESLGYAMLARHLGPQQKVYKIQAEAPIVSQRPYTEAEMQSLAKEYVAAMRSVQPQGPYCLGGLCDGAHISERVVLELEARGQAVGLFAVIDTWVMQHSQRPWLWRIDYFQQRWRQARNHGLAGQFQLFKRAITSQLRRWTGNAPVSKWGEAYWPTNFTPKRFRAPIVLFKRPKQPFYYVKDRQMGWGSRTSSTVEIHEIDFDHLQLLREPHVRVLGEELAVCIERVGAQNGHGPARGSTIPQAVTSNGRSG